MYVNVVVCVPVPIESVPLTATVPEPTGTTTVALVAVRARTGATAFPNRIVATDSARPPIVTCMPATPCVAPSAVIWGHDQPGATGVPTPLARSGPALAV